MNLVPRRDSRVQEQHLTGEPCGAATVAGWNPLLQTMIFSPKSSCSSCPSWCERPLPSYHIGWTAAGGRGMMRATFRVGATSYYCCVERKPEKHATRNTQHAIRTEAMPKLRRPKIR